MRAAGLLIVLATGVVMTSVGFAAPSASPSFVSRGQAICKSYASKDGRIAHPAQTVRGLTAWEKKMIPLETAEIADFKAFAPVSSEATKYRAWLSVLDELVAHSKTLVAAGDRGDKHGVFLQLALTVELGHRGTTLAKQLGLTACT